MYAALAAGTLLVSYCFFSASVLSHFRQLRSLPASVIRVVEPVVESGMWRWVGFALVAAIALGTQAAAIGLLSVAGNALEAAVLVAEMVFALLWTVLVWRASVPYAHPPGRT